MVTKTKPAKPTPAAFDESTIASFADPQPLRMGDADSQHLALKIKQVRAGATLPTYGTAGAACFDLYAVIERVGVTQHITIEPGSAETINLGFAFEVPEGYVMLLHSRSGHGYKHGLRLCNSTGIIDSDFRGEMLARLHNDGPHRQRIGHGDRVAQAMLIPVPRVAFVQVDELSETVRGTGGLGSTGK